MERKNGVPSSGSVVSFESSYNPRKEDKVTKSEFVDQVASESGLSKGEATKAVEASLKVIEDTLKGGGEINITGFGKFSVAERGARQGVNPQTGERIQIGGGGHRDPWALLAVGDLAALSGDVDFHLVKLQADALVERIVRHREAARAVAAREPRGAGA